MAGPRFNDDFGENGRALELFFYLFLKPKGDRISRHTTARNIETIFADYGLNESFSPHQFDNSLRLLQKKGLVDESGIPAKGSVQYALNAWQRSYGRQRFDPSRKGSTRDDRRLAAIIWHCSDLAARFAGVRPLSFDGLPGFFSKSRRMLAHGRASGLSFNETRQLRFMFDCLRRDWESFTEDERERLREAFGLYEGKSSVVSDAESLEKSDISKILLFPLLLPF